MDRLPLFFATLCFLIAFARTLLALGAGQWQPSRLSLAALGLGFLAQTGFLWQRGITLGQCPLTNLFEVLIFLNWAILGFYFLIGHTYRLSLLGVFTAPLVLLVQGMALLLPLDTPARPLVVPPNRWIEWHAALSIAAYGAFAMAAVAGVMYLLQERQLKTHRLQSLFFQMPPITTLAEANFRLLWTGWLLLTAGLLAGQVAAIGTPVWSVKIVWGVAMCALYLAILWIRRKNPRRTALLSLLAFAVTFPMLWSLTYFTRTSSLLP